MPTHATVQKVDREPDWDSGSHGVFHVYRLSVDAFDKPVKINRKPDSPVLQSGQQVWLDNVRPGGGALIGKIVPPPEQTQQFAQAPGTNSTPAPRQHDNRDESIERQSCVRSAALLYQGQGTAPVDVLSTADLFLQWVQQR